MSRLRARILVVTVLVLAMPAGPVSNASAVASPRVTQVTCPHDVLERMSNVSRVACWRARRGSIREALLKSERDGIPFRLNLLRGVPLATRMTRDVGTSDSDYTGWISKGEPPLVLILDARGDVAVGDAWLPGDVFRIEKMETSTFAVGKVWAYGPHHPDEPSPAPMTAPPVVERPPVAAAPSPRPRPKPTRTIAPTAAPAVASQAVTAAPHPLAVHAPGRGLRWPAVGVAAFLVALAAAGVLVSGRRSA